MKAPLSASLNLKFSKPITILFAGRENQYQNYECKASHYGFVALAKLPLLIFSCPCKAKGINSNINSSFFISYGFSLYHFFAATVERQP